MINRSIAFVGLAGIFILSACSSSSNEPSKAVPPPTNSTSSNTVVVNSGSEIAQQQPADATNSTASSDADGGVANRMDARLGKMRQAGEAGSDVDALALAMKNAKPAPDNSTFVSFLTDVGYEIRTFKNHPQLLKAEKTISAAGKQSLKVFLRNGRVVEVPAERVAALATISAASLLEAAGINQQPPAPQKAPVPSSQGQKKSGE